MTTPPQPTGLPLALMLMGWNETETNEPSEKMATDDFANWRAALAGEKLMVYEDEPWCGYFRQRDRRGLNLQLAPIKRPWIACAIWRNEAGELVAERAKEAVPIDWIWPHCVSHPIPYETYEFWHQNERWPEEADAA